LYFPVTNAAPTVSSIFATTPAGQAALTVLINGQGRVDATPRANAYTIGQPVTLTATPDNGQTFLGWSGDASGNQNPLSFTIDQTKVISANFSGLPILRTTQLGIEGLTSAGFRLTLVSQPQTVYQIQRSTDLSSWETIGVVTNTVGEVQFSDPGAMSNAFRFYRAVSQ